MLKKNNHPHFVYQDTKICIVLYTSHSDTLYIIGVLSDPSFPSLSEL